MNLCVYHFKVTPALGKSTAILQPTVEHFEHRHGHKATYSNVVITVRRVAKCNIAYALSSSKIYLLFLMYLVELKVNFTLGFVLYGGKYSGLKTQEKRCSYRKRIVLRKMLEQDTLGVATTPIQNEKIKIQ